MRDARIQIDLLRVKLRVPATTAPRAEHICRTSVGCLDELVRGNGWPGARRRVTARLSPEPLRVSSTTGDDAIARSLATVIYRSLREGS